MSKVDRIVQEVLFSISGPDIDITKVTEEQMRVAKDSVSIILEANEYGKNN